MTTKTMTRAQALVMARRLTGEGKNQTDIAKTLADHGFLTKTGKPIHQAAVSAMLRRARRRSRPVARVISRPVSAKAGLIKKLARLSDTTRSERLELIDIVAGM